MKWILAFVVLLVGAALIAWNAVYPYAFNHHAAERQIVWQAAQTMHVNPWLLTAVIESESHFNPAAISRRGAVGLMQIEPSTGVWVESQSRIAGPVESPETNVLIGAWYLRYLQRDFHGNLLMALAAYNGGPAVVKQWERDGDIGPEQSIARIPYGETRYFVTRVLWRYRFYRWISHHSAVIADQSHGHATVWGGERPGQDPERRHQVKAG